MKKFVAIALLCAAMAAQGAIAPAGAQPGDQTGLLQAMFDNLKPGDTLVIPPGTYNHGGVVKIKVPGVRIDGGGATLNATNDVASGLQIWADDVSLSNIHLTAPIGGKRYYNTDQHKLLVRADRVALSDIVIDGSAAAGVYIAGSDGFRVDRVTVRDTRADGVAMADGSRNGVVNNAHTERTGDDGVSIVTYTGFLSPYKGPPCSNIQINSPVVTTTPARGIIVSGGQDIAIQDVRVADTEFAGIQIMSQSGRYFTADVHGIRVSGGTVTAGNKGARTPTGAVTAWSSNLPVTDVVFSDLTVTDTGPNVSGILGVQTRDGGSVAGIQFHDIRIEQGGDLPVINADAPPGSYSATGISVNGQPAV